MVQLPDSSAWGRVAHLCAWRSGYPIAWIRPDSGILTPGFGYSTAVPKFPDRPGMENRVQISYA